MTSSWGSILTSSACAEADPLIRIPTVVVLPAAPRSSRALFETGSSRTARSGLPPTGSSILSPRAYTYDRARDERCTVAPGRVADRLTSQRRTYQLLDLELDRDVPGAPRTSRRGRCRAQLGVRVAPGRLDTMVVRSAPLSRASNMDRGPRWGPPVRREDRHHRWTRTRRRWRTSPKVATWPTSADPADRAGRRPGRTYRASTSTTPRRPRSCPSRER